MIRLGAALLLLAAPLPASAQDATISVPENDPEMRAAIAKARAGLPVFFGHVTAPAPGEGGFLIKFDLIPGAAAEFVWAEIVSHRGGASVARLVNAPLARGFVKGQQVTVQDGEVIDWAWWREGVMQGGATMRVLIARMPPAEAQAMRARFGW
ncbi:uncharacterized protein YegJ (DUF2314 family) [Sphingomonas naasensis]|uniref:DUF2314 domain-containing protein n=1 Tax=Sphingomonas naasensis TaxID=1344951 RepID=A0A4S1W6E0_9SPHN|nr:DUF2314 domain-containing protein [Sphingomonas naasensis]NIJ19934.1 uncharacterized protein YegJ (DUF2314 family) [Sphingomonas naasensis]TGX37893.1 DUF2314 domain-containing protein [Sphingomonas naasensis]